MGRREAPLQWRGLPESRSLILDISHKYDSLEVKTLYRDCLIDSDVLYNSRVKIYPNDILKYTVFNKLIFNPDKAELVNKINDYLASKEA